MSNLEMSKNIFISAIVSIIVHLICMASFSGCSKKYSSGVFLSTKESNFIKDCRGKCDYSTITKEIGYPIIEEGDTKYYIGLNYEKFGFLAPKISKSEISELRFDEKGKLISYNSRHNSFDNGLVVAKHYDKHYHNRTSPIEKFMKNARKFTTPKAQRVKARYK